jgi:peptide/nickel transport system permease protein
MRGFLMRRLLSAVPTLLGITFVTFLLLEILPGREIALAGGDAGTIPSQQTLSRLREMYHLDEPLPRRYLVWLLRFCRWDWGESLLDGRSVTGILRETAPRTLVLNSMALLVAFVVAVPLGTGWASHPGSASERAGSILLYVLYALPTFAAALLLQQWLAVKHGWLPLQGMTSLPSGAGFFPRTLDLAIHSILPVVCLAYGTLAYLTRFTRANVFEALRCEYITAGRGRGLGEGRLLWKHAFRNAAIPLLTLLGVLIPALLGGSVLVETIFSWPGMGRL